MLMNVVGIKPPRKNLRSQFLKKFSLNFLIFAYVVGNYVFFFVILAVTASVNIVFPRDSSERCYAQSWVT